MSYVNVILYGAVIPSFDTGKDDGKNDDEKALDAGDSANWDKIKDYYRKNKK